jgi:hypothetical protein
MLSPKKKSRTIEPSGAEGKEGDKPESMNDPSTSNRGKREKDGTGKRTKGH